MKGSTHTILHELCDLLGDLDNIEDCLKSNDKARGSALVEKVRKRANDVADLIVKSGE